MMKRLFILSVIVASAGSLLASCGKEPDVVKIPVASDVPIIFADPIQETKGNPELETLERLAAQKFSVSAWYTPEGETFGSTSSLYIQNHRFGRINTTWCGVTSGGDADPVFYPLDGTLTYFCYAPYRDDISSTSDVNVVLSPDPAITSLLPNYLESSPLICFTPSDSPSAQIDFIASTPVVDVSRSAGTIPLDFTNHMTTNVQFHCLYTGTLSSGEGVVVSQIVIRDVIGSEYLYFTDSACIMGHNWCDNVSPEDGGSSMPLASYTLSQLTYDLITESPYLDKAGEPGSVAKWVNNTINGRLYLLPQSMPAGAYLDITYSVRNMSTGSALDENVVSIPLSGTASWPVGKTVKYTITIPVQGRQGVSLSTEIVAWADSGNEHEAEELLY